MPLYEYYCVECNHSFDSLRPMSKADAVIKCPKCASTQASRVLSLVAAPSRGEKVAAGGPLQPMSMGGGCCGGSCGCGH